MDYLWDPFEEFKKMRNFFKESELKFPKISEIKVREPLIDIIDEGKTIKVIAELPGVKKEDIEINVQERSISISSKTKESKEEKKKGYYFKERKFQKFYRLIPLPTKVISEKSKAKYKNGILEIILYKEKPTKKIKATKIKIE